MKLPKWLKAYMEKILEIDDIKEKQKIQNQLENTLMQGLHSSNGFIKETVCIELGAMLEDYLPSCNYGGIEDLMDKSLSPGEIVMNKVESRINLLKTECKKEKDYGFVNGELSYLINKYELK